MYLPNPALRLQMTSLLDCATVCSVKPESRDAVANVLSRPCPCRSRNRKHPRRHTVFQTIPKVPAKRHLHQVFRELLERKHRLQPIHFRTVALQSGFRYRNFRFEEARLVDFS